MAGLLAGIRRLNRLGDRAIAEPFAGGAGASLTLLYFEEAHRIYINDADQAIHDFWWTLVNRPGPFMHLLASTRVNCAEWRRQRDEYRRHGGGSRLRHGFAAFYLNRCNHSGIIMNGGPIGGVSQKGAWKIGARFNRPDLLQRCEKVVEYRQRINVSGRDAIHFMGLLDPDKTFFFIDPPYFEKGPTLYLDPLDEKYHSSLAEQLKKRPDGAWVLTYDDCPAIRRMYQGWAAIQPFSLRYTAAKRRTGKEVLITPKWMALPASQSSAALGWKP